ncbi:sugar phosphate isomerase/epimerase, partial [Planktomarina temperata]|nr:sugar phosphate isomerase/epimerase [Planktomarina temperata]
EQGAAEGAPFIADHLIRRTERAFDDFAGGSTNRAALRKLMGF